MYRRMACLGCLVAMSVAGLRPVSVARAVAGEEPGRPAILDEYSHWRCHATVRPIPFGTQKDHAPNEKGTMAIGFRTMGREKPAVPLDGPVTPPPPPDWAGADFDDSRWWRDPGPFFGGAPFIYGHRTMPHYNLYGVEQSSLLYMLCVRGRFTVEDPAAVRSLRFSAEFRGGMRVLLNGAEVGRSHLPQGEIDFDTLADDYPLEASLDADGKPYGVEGNKAEGGVLLRVRTLKDLELPKDKLRKGVNVLALEIHRAALPLELTKLSRRQSALGFVSTGHFWNTVGLMKLALVADGGGVIPNVGRPKGLQVWNVSTAESVYESDYADPNEPLRPIRIVGTRNGAFAGEIVAGSDGPIRDLRAEVTELKHEGGRGTLPVSAMQIRYGRASAVEWGSKVAYPAPKRGKWTILRFHELLDTPPDQVPVKAFPGGCSGAVQPVWLTVKVSADAEPGVYTGTLTVSAAGVQPVRVPVRLEVEGFRLPDPGKFQIWADFLQSPENLSERYKVPMWSDAHWALIRKSMEFMTEVDNKTLYLPVICRCNVGNSQSMIRWVRDGSGYKPDLSIVEKYLDTALASGLKPEMVCFQVWDYHIGLNYDRKFRIGTGMYGQPTGLGKDGEDPGLQPVPVTLFDPATGAATEMKSPAYDDPAAEAFWKPAVEGIRGALAKRGIEKTVMLGLVPDFIPKKEVLEFWTKMLPEAPWVTMGHGLPPIRGSGRQGPGEDDPGTAKQGEVRVLYDTSVGYATTVFGVHFAVDPAVERQLGWKRSDPVAYFWRSGGNKTLNQLAADRTLFEVGLTAGTRGSGRLALDFFAFVEKSGSGGQDLTKEGGYPEWGSLTLAPAWLAAGPEGPISTTRFEMAREAIQECEARIFLEQALDDAAKRQKLGEPLAQRVQDILDERTRCVIWANEIRTNLAPQCSMPGGPLGFDWYAGSDWEGRSAKLYAAAAEVAAALGVK